MKFKTEIEKRIGRGSDTDLFGNLVFNLMANLNQPYSEILDMSLPMALHLNKLLEKEMKHGK